MSGRINKDMKRKGVSFFFFFLRKKKDIVHRKNLFGTPTDGELLI